MEETAFFFDDEADKSPASFAGFLRAALDVSRDVTGAGAAAAGRRLHDGV